MTQDDYIRLLEETARLYKRASAYWDNVAKLALESKEHALDCVESMEKIKETRDELKGLINDNK